MNEKEFIEKILNKESEIPNKFSFMRLIDMIAKYHVNSFDKQKDLLNIVKSEIEKLEIDYYVDFKYDKVIRKIVKNVFSNNLQLRIVESIVLYKDELDLINTLEKDRDKKLLFTCYIIARFYNTEGWVNMSRIELFKLANITLTSKERNITIGKLIQGGYLQDSKKNENLNIKVNFIEGEKALEVKELENVGNQFIAMTKKDYKMCQVCGKLIKINGNKIKFCKQCAYKTKLEKNNEYYHNK